MSGEDSELKRIHDAIERCVTKPAPCSLKIDASEFKERVEQELELLKRKGVSEKLLGLFYGRCISLLDEVVLSYHPATTGAGNIGEIIIKFDLGALHELAAAIRAENINNNGAIHN
ncbi:MULTISPECIES: hypothetical protein [Edwardsiella]|nr:hypothetical protein [Edwardsiella anguillarum]AKM48221.1 hypothetical protein QY76_13645 [Edwardsiella sp. EA181011]RFT05467.1 hypothetical protein CGL57_00015 [Edwardsiella anguillarum]